MDAARPALDPVLTRPFVRADLAPVPPGWSTGPPDFVGIGCGKAGSTWWWNLLKRHPGVVQNRLGKKELHYFCHFDHRGPSADDLAVYREAFAAPPGRIVGDWSCSYLCYPLALEYLASAAPDARLVALVRDPVERALSAYNMFLRGRAKLFDLDPERERALVDFSLFPEALRTSRLAPCFREALRSFPREQLLVLQYERCRLDPEGELRRTLRFLGLDEARAPRQHARRINPSTWVLPAATDEERRRLARWFADDVRELAKLLPELELALWPSFAATSGEADAA